MADKTTKPTKEQIEAWKKEHGDVFHYKTKDGKECYFRRPSRSVLAAGAIVAGNDNYAYKQFVLTNIFLGGDSELVSESKQGDKYFLPLAQQVEAMIETVEGELKKV
ncbi:MAG: hypothetical protein RSB32_07460, partial [Mucinivorans sp.]